MNQCIYRYNLYKYNTCICYISLLSMIWAMTYISCHTICIVIDVHQTKWKSYPHMPINGTTPTDFIVSLNCKIFSSISDDNSNDYKPPYKFKIFNGKLWLLCSLAVMCLCGKTAPPLEAADSLKQTSPTEADTCSSIVGWLGVIQLHHDQGVLLRLDHMWFTTIVFLCRRKL